MADILALGAAVHTIDRNLAAARRRRDDLDAKLAALAGEPAAHAVGQELIAQKQLIDQLSRDRDAARAAQAAAAAQDPIHAADASVPLVLLPVRIETAYLPGASGTDLAVRVYPDDIHVDAHEPELTDEEHGAAAAYWRVVWGAGANQARLDAAWTALLGRLKPARAAWSIQTLTPAVARPANETPLDQPQPEPPLATIARRRGNFTRAANTALLPDRWHVIGFRDNAVLFNVRSTRIPDSLDVSFGPPDDLPALTTSLWLDDLDAAIAEGMAVRIPLVGPDFSVEQLFVVGVRAAVPPAEGAQRLQSALRAHCYTSGLGFLAPGTPTNNTSASRSAWQSAPVPPAPSEIAAARRAFLADSQQNAALVAAALGIDGADVLAGASHGLDDQQSPALAMQRLLWPKLLGEGLMMMLRHAGDTGTSDSRDVPAVTGPLIEHAITWVRGRGSLPVLRVGNQPYGLLPASSLAGFARAAADPPQQLIDWMRVFQSYWLAAVGHVPRVTVGADPNPDATIVNVLSRAPYSRQIMVRDIGDRFDQATFDRALPVAAIPGLSQKSEMFFSPLATNAVRLPVKIVEDGDVDRALLQRYLRLITDGIAVMEGKGGGLQWVSDRKAFFRGPNPAQPADLFASLALDALVMPPFPGEATSLLNLMFLFIGGISAGGHEITPKPALIQQFAGVTQQARDLAAQLELICKTDVAEYEPLLCGTLDVFSHRFDAWVTSLAARRLHDLRAAKPSGVVIGAYGWVEDLAPRTDLTPVAPPAAGFPAAFASARQHYVHAPSLHHAATAAVLRAGFDSHPDPSVLAVNLASRRVRLADWLAAGVRNGQPLGALLGYRFERGLHEVGRENLIAKFRAEHPLPLTPSPDGDGDGTAARDAITARNVVDGLDVYRRRGQVLTNFPNDKSIQELIDDLVDAVDSLGDLLLAETVHHMVGGNPLRAGVAADAVGRGEPLPERFDVVRTPRSGRPLTWQVGALLPAGVAPLVTGWRLDRPRAALEPTLHGWAAAMLGDADRWQVTCSFTLGTPVTQTIGLDALGLCALDVVVEAAGHPSLLEQRIVDAVTARNPSARNVAVERGPAADGRLGLAELVGLTERIRTVLASAVPLGPQHVAGANVSPGVGLQAGELAGRLGTFHGSLAAAVSGLAGAVAGLEFAAGTDAATLLAVRRAVRAALVAVADHGIASSYPTADAEDPASTDKLHAQARKVLDVAQPLADAVPPAAPADAVPPAAPADAAPPTALSGWLRSATDYAEAIVGRGVPLLPTFVLPADSAFAASFSPAAAPTGADRAAVLAWLRRIGRLRPGVAALSDVLVAAETLARSTLALTLAQLPAETGARWIGLPFGGAAPAKARVATVVTTFTRVDPTAAFGGFVADTWTEHLPGLTTVAADGKYEAAEVTGLAFTVDAPDAYPPQAILLAVPPEAGRGWSLDVLLDVVRETLDLAKMRGVDLGDLPRLGRVLPFNRSGGFVENMLKSAGLTP